jgi:type III secretory pathway component EscV
LLKQWILINKSKYLILNYNDFNKPISETAYSKRVVHIFNKYLGLKINVQILRQIKESCNIYENKNYNDMNLNEKIELSKKMLHSYEMSHQYAKKN